MKTLHFNDIIFSESPYACVVKDEFQKSICSYCFKTNLKLQTCSQCDRNSYCDKVCQRKDWKQHKLECKSFCAQKSSLSDISLLILRIICKNKDVFDTEPIGVKINNYGIKPRSFDDLVSNLDDEGSTAITDFQSIWDQLEIFLKPIGMYINDFISQERVKIIFAKCITNNFEIQDCVNTTIGYGCYLNGSGLNHSCWPNSYYSFTGNQYVLRALKDIKSTDEIYINYTDPLQLRKDRRAHLKQQYLFDCQCEACINDELEKEMSQLFCSRPGCKGYVTLENQSEDYKCDLCDDIEDKAQMDFRHSIFKAKLFHLNNLMINNDYERAYELSMRELKEFHLHWQRENSGGLYQLCLGEKAFESAIFLQDYTAAIGVCRLKPGSKSWIHERLSRFFGTANHPVAKCHLEKYDKLLELYI